MADFKKVTHCIFDMDGLILGTESLYTLAVDRIICKYGKKMTWEHKGATMGFQPHMFTKYLVDTFELPLTQEEVLVELQKTYCEVFPTVQVLPGADILLHHLKANNIPIALATSSSAESYELKTKNWKALFDLFHHRVLGGSDPEVKNGKPHPDIFLVAAGRFDDNPDPSTCLVFEDAPNGVEAAVSAGMQVVMVPDPNLPEHYTTKATQVLKSLEDFKPEQFGLPKRN